MQAATLQDPQSNLSNLQQQQAQANTQWLQALRMVYIMIQS